MKDCCSLNVPFEHDFSIHVLFIRTVKLFSAGYQRLLNYFQCISYFHQTDAAKCNVSALNQCKLSYLCLTLYPSILLCNTAMIMLLLNISWLPNKHFLSHLGIYISSTNILTINTSGGRSTRIKVLCNKLESCIEKY